MGVNSNPLTDLVEKAKQQQIEKELESIKSDLARILDTITLGECSKMITLTDFDNQKFSVNPHYIVTIVPKPDNKGCTIVVRLSAESAPVDVQETHDQVVKMINGTKSYIK